MGEISADAINRRHQSGGEALLDDARAADPVDRLLEDSWVARSGRASRRELIVETAATLLFLVLAAPLAATALATHSLDTGLALMLVGLYAFVAGTIRFPIGAGYVVPTYVMLVPMLLLLPPGVVPLLAAAGLVLASLGRWAARRGSAEHVLFAVPNAWHTVGPAIVLIAFGRTHGTGASVAVYCAAFAAACVCDLLASTLRESLSEVVAPRVQLRVAIEIWMLDACIAPIGLLLASAGRHHAVALLIVLPVAALLFLLQRDRSARIEQAQHRLELAVTDPLTRLGNRRKLASDLGQHLGATARADNPVLLMVFDLDGFKNYNDTFGHPAGDALLAHLGARLAAVLAPSGTAYRLGGDEFCVIIPARRDEVDELVARACEALREDSETFSIGASCGAVMIPEEASTPEYALQLADERMYARKSARQSPDAHEQTRDVLVRIMHAKQPGLQDHSSHVSQLAVSVGRRLGMDSEQLDELARAADLHDIGKVGIPDAILEKPGRLDQDEWSLIRQHTILGERILSAAPALRPVAAVVRSSHERWDGTGYPDGLAGEAIPLAARIVAVCDAYDAMRTDRCYRKGRSRRNARDELLWEAGRQFDPVVVAALLDELDTTETLSPKLEATPRGGRIASRLTSAGAAGPR